MEPKLENEPRLETRGETGSADRMESRLIINGDRKSGTGRDYCFRNFVL